MIRNLLLTLLVVVAAFGSTRAPSQVIETLAPKDLSDWSRPEFWQTFGGDPAPEGWEFADGEIRLADPKKASSIVSVPLPSNFELTWKWKIEKGVNSGLKYRVRRFGNHMFNNNYLGLEYQIIDSEPNSTSPSSTASIYALVGPKTEKVLHPPGEWNESKVVAIGDYVEHHLNGQLVASSRTTGPAWDTRIALSKFYGATDFGRPQKGDRFMLTDHGGKVAYKDFQFAAKQTPPDEPTKSTGPFLANAMRNGWAKHDSIVIWTRTTRNPEMTTDGKQFVSIEKKDANKFSKLNDPEKLLDMQLPKGASLDEMFGACPGAVGKVRLSYYPGKSVNQLKQTDWVTTTADSDFTAQWKLDGLRPNSKYAAIIEARSTDDTPTAVVRGSFRTAPKPNDTENLKFCITTCHDFIRRDDGLRGHKIYPAMKEISPHFIVHAGDIEYYDKPDPWAWTVELMRFKWGRIFSLPSNREFYSQTTSYFIKDDHDTLSNDSWPGRSYGAVPFERGVELFNKEQFPRRDPRYTSIRWGRDLEIWVLEGRDYRSPNTMPDGPDKTILGAEQKAWLFKSLEESEAKFKLICSPTPIVGPDRKNKKDNHANEVFAHEGNEIRERISQIPGVIVFCGDRHWQYASVDEKTNLWEFGCGPGSEKHQLGWKAGDERPVHRFLRVKGGFLSGQLTYQGKRKESKLTIRHHSVTGDQVSKFVFPTENDTTDEAKQATSKAATKNDDAQAKSKATAKAKGSSEKE